MCVYSYKAEVVGVHEKTNSKNAIIVFVLQPSPGIIFQFIPTKRETTSSSYSQISGKVEEINRRTIDSMFINL